MTGVDYGTSNTTGIPDSHIPMPPSPSDGANDIIEALKKNTRRIEEKVRVIYAEYIEFLQKKDKSLSKELNNISWE